MKTRPGTLDEYVVKEQGGYKSLFEGGPEEGVVLDIGANIGAFSNHYANLYPGLRFHSYEPESENFKLAKLNCSGLKNVTLYNSAAGHVGGQAVLYVNEKKNKGAHSILETRFRSKQLISIEPFSELLAKHRPTYLKFDAEGAEYKVLGELMNLPETVFGIAIELHLGRRRFKHLAWELELSLLSQFPVVKKGGRLHTKTVDGCKAWHDVFIGQRA